MQNVNIRMKEIKTPIYNLMNQPNQYKSDISKYNSVICYISFFEKATEDDYVIYHKNNRFEYTPEFYSFIQSLYNADLVASDSEMKSFLKSLNCIATEKSSCYNIWIKDMNKIINDDSLLTKTNICFLRLAIATMIRLETLIPGSWGMDIENGTWLRILKQLKAIYPDIYTPCCNSHC